MTADCSPPVAAAPRRPQSAGFLVLRHDAMAGSESGRALADRRDTGLGGSVSIQPLEAGGIELLSRPAGMRYGRKWRRAVAGLVTRSPAGRCVRNLLRGPYAGLAGTGGNESLRDAVGCRCHRA
jgi:hypothetical protein